MLDGYPSRACRAAARFLRSRLSAGCRLVPWPAAPWEALPGRPQPAAQQAPKPLEFFLTDRSRLVQASETGPAAHWAIGRPSRSRRCRQRRTKAMTPAATSSAAARQSPVTSSCMLRASASRTKEKSVASRAAMPASHAFVGSWIVNRLFDPRFAAHARALYYSAAQERN